MEDRKNWNDSESKKSQIPSKFLPNSSRATGFRHQICRGFAALKLFDLSRATGLGLDGLVGLARLKLSLVGVLVVTLELVLAGKADLVVFAAKSWAFEAFGLDAMLGRGVAQEVIPAFSDEFAAGLTASPISNLAIMVFTTPATLMPTKLY